MASKGKAVGAMIKYAPLLLETSRRYGPRVWEQVKSQKEPAERYVHDKVDRGNQRKKAVQHADTVIDGSTLRIFHRNLAHWVVFSGDEPIAVHPRTNAPFSQLLKNADLSKRTRPEDEPALAQRLRMNARARRSSPGRTTRTGRQHHAQADVDLGRHGASGSAGSAAPSSQTQDRPGRADPPPAPPPTSSASP